MVQFPEDYYFIEIFGLRQAWKMDMHILISALSVMYSCILCTVCGLPTREAPTVSPITQERHVRIKRCSCASFLDKECVYFCHLDIIWVNTPERVVSYGMGNAPRAKRAVAESISSIRSRCQCLQENDNTCTNFCRLEKHLRYGMLPDKAIRFVEGDGCVEAQCKHKLAADTGRIKRMMYSNKKLVSPLASRVALKIRLLLEKWMTRQRHRARVWEGKSAAS